MARKLNARQLTGRDDSHLVDLPQGHRLQVEVAAAFANLQADAREHGFDLAIASSFRSFSRQLTLWNRKASGERPVHDDQGCNIAMADLSPTEQLHAILRFSAIPGSSRHHWGTDLDVFDGNALPGSYELQLSPEEVATGGMFDPLHCWLDARMAAGESHGFYRPYGRDRGGVAMERWHLSYAPLSLACAELLDTALLQSCWNCEEQSEALLLRREIDAQLPQLIERYVTVPDDGWAQASV